MSYQEFRPGGFSVIPVVTKYILGLNIIIFVVPYLLRVDLNHYLALYYYKSQYFRPYQVITHMFAHAGFSHILFNMLGVYTFGSILERLWGSKRFLNFYILSGLGGALAQMGSFYYTDLKLNEAMFAVVEGIDITTIYDHMRCVGASGALMGLLGGFAFLFPNTPLSVYFLPPIKAKYIVAIYGGISLIFGFGSALGSLPGGNIAHFAHLGGLVVGLIIVYIWRKKSKTFF